MGRGYRLSPHVRSITLYISDFVDFLYLFHCVSSVPCTWLFTAHCRARIVQLHMRSALVKRGWRHARAHVADVSSTLQ